MNQTERDNREMYSKMINTLKDIHYKLSALETDFVEDMECRVIDEESFLTEKQIEKLEELYERYC